MTDEELKADFIRRCQHLLELSDEIHGASVNLPQMAQTQIGPMEIFGTGEDFEQLRASTTWPPHAKGPIPFLIVDPENRDTEICLMPVLREYIKVLRQHMVLDDLASIRPND